MKFFPGELCAFAGEDVSRKGAKFARENKGNLVKKALLKTIYNLGGFALFQQTTRDKVLILTYHRFSREKHPSKISGAEFSKHLAYLVKHHRVLSLTEAVDALKNEEPLPPNAAVITIDDGCADAYEVAFPVLKQFNLPATIYVVTDFLDGKCWLWTDLTRYILRNTKLDSLKIEFGGDDKIETKLADAVQRTETANRINSRLKKLPDEAKENKIKEIADNLKVGIPAAPVDEFKPISWEQAREMDAGNVQIESHTVTHPILTNINGSRLDYELQTSRKRLEHKLEKEVRHFCYPNGSLNDAVKAAVVTAGYASAVTTAYGFNESGANQFVLNRIDALAAIENFAQSASGFEAFKQNIK